jgi:hypothetical protein
MRLRVIIKFAWISFEMTAASNAPASLHVLLSR